MRPGRLPVETLSGDIDDTDYEQILGSVVVGQEEAVQAAGTLTLTFSADHPGPFNMPLLLHATALKGENDPVITEAKIEVVTVK